MKFYFLTIVFVSQGSTFMLGNLPYSLELLHVVTLSKNQFDDLLDEIENHLSKVEAIIGSTGSAYCYTTANMQSNQVPRLYSPGVADNLINTLLFLNWPHSSPATRTLGIWTILD